MKRKLFWNRNQCVDEFPHVSHKYVIKGDDSQPVDFWEWTENYLCLDVNTKECETQQIFMLEIPGVLVDPLGPSVSKPVGTNVSPHLPTWSIPTQN